VAYIDGFQNDVFVSYAYADNEPGLGGYSWVTRFVGHLETALRQRLGCGDKLSIYIDTRDLSSNNELEELLEQARQSVVFLAILSPSYLQRSWTRKELDAFTGLPGYKQRLFVMELLPAFEPLRLPPSLETISRTRFWKEVALESRSPISLDPELHRELYAQRLLNLADQMRSLLVGKKLVPGMSTPETAPSDSASQVVPRPSADDDTIGTVFLAQCTDDLELEREQVKSFLQQMGANVVPEGDYPQGGDSFRECIKVDLRRADLAVMLVGKSPGRLPPDLPGGYLRSQFDVARHLSTPLMIWQHPEMDLDAIASPEHREILASNHVLVSGLESFKSEVIAALTRAVAPERTHVGSMVYIGADRLDIEVAKTLQETLAGRSYPVTIPTFDGSAEDIRRDLEDSLSECEALVFVHGDAPINWVRGNLRRIHKLMAVRKTEPKLVALFTVPPADAAKVGVSLPYLKVIKASKKDDFEPVLVEIEAST
jgi:hypothetical protein